MTLTWGLCIATYKRHDVLVRCVELALEQTRAPVEIVICDSTPDEELVEQTRNRLQTLITERSPGLRLVYDRARIARQTSQRAQAVEQATADVLFMIDDDTLMYPECAESLMQVYEADSAGHVAGATALMAGMPPGEEAESPPPDSSGGVYASAKKSSTLRGLLYRAMRLWRSPRPRGFVDYAWSATPDARCCDFIIGAGLTVRRSIAEQLGFDEALVFNRHEDADFCFRARRVGLLIEVQRPLMHHLMSVTAEGKRRAGFDFGYAFALNAAYLSRKHYGAGPIVSLFVFYKHLQQVLFEAIAGVLKGFDFGQFLGAAYASKDVASMALMSQERLSEELIQRSEAYRNR